MLLNNLFIDNPINFEKRCKTRIIASCLLLVLGAVTIALSFLAGDHIPVLYMTADHYDFIPGFYMGTGFGLLFAAIATIIKNVRYLKKPDLKKEREIYETDERNRMLGLRSWAYAGYDTPGNTGCLCTGPVYLSNDTAENNVRIYNSLVKGSGI